MRSCLSNGMHGGGERDRGQLEETNRFSFLLSRFTSCYVEGDEQFELKLRRFHLKWLFSNCPLNFWYLAIRTLFKENLFFFLIFPESITIRPLDFNIIYKTIFDFCIIQFSF